jgi:hypothetical protein
VLDQPMLAQAAQSANPSPELASRSRAKQLFEPADQQEQQRNSSRRIETNKQAAEPKTVEPPKTQDNKSDHNKAQQQRFFEVGFS